MPTDKSVSKSNFTEVHGVWGHVVPSPSTRFCDGPGQARISLTEKSCSLASKKKTSTNFAINSISAATPLLRVSSAINLVSRTCCVIPADDDFARREPQLHRRGHIQGAPINYRNPLEPPQPNRKTARVPKIWVGEAEEGHPNMPTNRCRHFHGGGVGGGAEDGLGGVVVTLFPQRPSAVFEESGVHKWCRRWSGGGSDLECSGDSSFGIRL